MTGTRVLTALVLLPVVVAAAWFGPPWAVAILAGVVIVLALREFFEISAQAGMAGFPKWTMICSLAAVALQWNAERLQGYVSGEYLDPMQYVSEVSPDAALLAFVFGAGVLVLAMRAPVEKMLPALASSAAGLLLVAYPLSFLVRLRGHGPRGEDLLFVLVLIWVGDSAAYFAGRALGKRPLASLISPKKTWEGAVANLLGSWVVAGVALIYFAGAARGFTAMPGVHLFAVATIVSVAGQVSDLVESAYKRSAGVKDSGALLPGHGGILDRIDALIFAAPAAWYYLMLFGGR